MKDILDSGEVLTWIAKLLSSEPIDLVRVLILFFTLIVLFWKLRQMLNESKKNHLLEKKQMTITYLQKIRGDYRDPIADIEKVYPSNTKIPLPNAIDDAKIKDAVEKVLSVVEHLSVPINDGIYDLNTLKRMSNQFFKNLFIKYEDYIVQSRIITGNQSKYIEFEKLYNKLD